MYYIGSNPAFDFDQRAKVATTTPMTTELFMQWKQKKLDEREAGLASLRAERAKNDRMRCFQMPTSMSHLVRHLSDMQLI